MGKMKELAMMIDEFEYGKKYNVEYEDNDGNIVKKHKLVYIGRADDSHIPFNYEIDRLKFYEGNQYLYINPYMIRDVELVNDTEPVQKKIQLLVDDGDNDKKKGNKKKKSSNVLDEMDGDGKVSPEDDTGELDIHCKKIDIKVKETNPKWKDDVLKTLGILYRPFILIRQCDEDKSAINPAMFIKKEEQELQFVMLKESSKLATIILINPEDVIGEHPRYKFFRIESLDPSYKISYVHSDHFVDYGVKLDVSPVPQPELALGKLYVVKTDGKTRIGILHAIMDDYLKFIVNDFDGMEIGKLVIRAEDMRDIEIYKVDDLSDEE